MNIFKFSDLDGRYMLAAPCRNGWIVLEEKHENIVIQYQYVPGFGAKVQSYQHGNRRLYIYGSKRLYVRHCFIKYPPSWAVAGCTLT